MLKLLGSLPPSINRPPSLFTLLSLVSTLHASSSRRSGGCDDCPRELGFPFFFDFCAVDQILG